MGAESLPEHSGFLQRHIRYDETADASLLRIPGKLFQAILVKGIYVSHQHQFG